MYHSRLLLDGKIMKTILRRVTRDQKGQALILAMILLLVGGLIAASLLGYMGTGLITGEVYEKRTAELYAADAGVEDAVWKIQHQDQVDEVKGLTKCYDSTNYTITNVNSKSVAVNITLVNNLTSTYRVESIATGDGSGTKIDAYITAIWGDFSGILDHVITSQGDYDLKGNQTQVVPPEGEEHGPVANYPRDWPKASDFAAWYWSEAKDYPYNFATLYVEDYATTGIGPLSRNGTLDIINTGAKDLILSLNGTIYITGDTLIGQSNQPFTIDLNGNTIFVESTTKDGQYALKIGGKCDITGSGCIIAVGDIDFQPNMACSRTDYVLVMSIEGKTYMHPNGDFYGTLAGSSEVEMQNGEAHWTDYSQVEGGLNFPMSTEGFRPVNYGIASWEVGPL
jgi:Tfp pilus assembly protein PilX